VDPSLKHLFKATDMREQGQKLMQMIAFCVKGLDALDQLVPAVQNLGKRHAAYGVTDAHYDTVGGALLWTLEKGLGPAFTPDVKSAWTTVYVLLASTMKSAAQT
jgi:hemoglobin-like flavoprotein